MPGTKIGFTGPTQTIKITCRCGNKSTETVPESSLEGSGQVAIYECKCGTQYVLKKDRIIRLSKTGMPERVLEKSGAKAPDNDTFEQTLRELKERGKVILPNDSRTIN